MNKQYVVVRVESRLSGLAILNNTSYPNLEDAINVAVLDFRIDNVGCYDPSDIDNMRNHFMSEGEKPYITVVGDVYMICAIEPKNNNIGANND